MTGPGVPSGRAARIRAVLRRTAGKVAVWALAAALSGTLLPRLADRFWSAPSDLGAARAAFAAQDPAQAAELARDASRADPGLIDARAVLLAAEATMADSPERWRELVPAARYLADANADDAADLGNAALVLLQAGHCSDAETLYRARIAEGGRDAETFVSLAEARLCVDGGAPGSAVAVLDRVTGTAAEDAHLLLSRAVLRAAVGRVTEARADLDAAQRAGTGPLGVRTAVACVRAAIAPIDPGAAVVDGARAVFEATRSCRHGAL